MSKERPNNKEIKTPDDLKSWFEKHEDSFCYVTGKTRQCWYIGHNSLMINGDRRQLEFKDMNSGVWRVTIKLKVKNEEKKEKEIA